MHPLLKALGVSACAGTALAGALVPRAFEVWQSQAARAAVSCRVRPRAHSDKNVTAAAVIGLPN